MTTLVFWTVGFFVTIVAIVAGIIAVQNGKDLAEARAQTNLWYEEYKQLALEQYEQSVERQKQLAKLGVQFADHLEDLNSKLEAADKENQRLITELSNRGIENVLMEEQLEIYKARANHKKLPAKKKRK